jgi:hypothetical protein
MAKISRRQTLEQWIDEALIDGEKDGTCCAMSLVHHTGSKENEVFGVRFNGAKQWTARELAGVFQGKADAFAQDLPGGAQLFSLLAMYGESPEPQARHPFQVIPETNFEGLVSEGPSEKGCLTQSMRHLEFQHREMNVMLRHLTDTLADSNKEQREYIKELSQENRFANQALREMALGRLTEEHKFRMEEKKADRENEMWEKLLEYGPLLLDSIAGGKLLPVSKKDTMLIDAIVRTVPKEKLIELVTSMPAEAAGPLVARLEEAHKANVLAEEAATKALEAGNPEDDAGGD